ncbi:E3 ubiquitin-protein ligase TRIM17-like [Macrotis lagotis]|uniref:E3 ubiquitin-protein ligase TRIM17-like n=1 Tax=Macrotis lagotis TaxID=92651 RepID=UPI003D692A23
MVADEIEEAEESLCTVCWELAPKTVIIECGHPACLSCLRKKPFCCPTCWEFSQLRTGQSDIVMHSEGNGMCELHREDQKLFCSTDQMLLCVTCSKSEDHEDHIHWPTAVAAVGYRIMIQIDINMIGCHMKEIQELQVCEQKSPLAWAVVWTDHEDMSRQDFEEKMLEILHYLRNKTKVTAKAEEFIMAMGNKKFIKLYQRLKQMEAAQELDIMKQKKEWEAMMSRKYKFLANRLRELEEKNQKSNLDLLEDVRNSFERTQMEGNFEPFIPHMDISYLNMTAKFLKLFHTSGLSQIYNSCNFSEENKSTITFVPGSSGKTYGIFTTGNHQVHSVRMRAFLLRTSSQDKILLGKVFTRISTSIWTIIFKG